MSEYKPYANPIWCSIGGHDILRYPGLDKPLHRLLFEKAWACHDCFEKVRREYQGSLSSAERRKYMQESLDL